MSEIDLGRELADPEQTELATYRPLCGSAIAGLIVGLLSPVALLHPVLWLIPWIAVAVCLYALYQISRRTSMVGRPAAVLGLAISLTCGVLAPARTFAYQYFQQSDARSFAALWFEYLRQGEPEKAYQLTQSPIDRVPLDDQLWTYYRTHSTHRAGLESYVETPVVRTLLALGPKAEVRYYENEQTQTDKGMDLVDDVYAVTYDDQGKKKTFFVHLQLNRSFREQPTAWRIVLAEGAYRPKSWTEPKK